MLKKYIVKNVIKNIIFLIFIVLVCFYNFEYASHTANMTAFWYDDLEYSNYLRDEGIFDCLFGKAVFQHGGGYIGLFLCKFLSFALPSFLNLHPADFISYEQGMIKGLLVAIIMLFIAKFSVVNFKSKFLYFCSLFFTSAYVFFVSSECARQVLIVNYNFYRYLLSLIFLCVFLHFIYKRTISKKQESPVILLWVSFCALSVGLSSEICSFSFFILVFSLIAYNYVISLCSKFIRREEINNYKLNLDRNFYIPVGFFLFAIVFFCSTPGFINVAFDLRQLSHITISIDLIIEFSQLLFNLYIVKL